VRFNGSFRGPGNERGPGRTKGPPYSKTMFRNRRSPRGGGGRVNRGWNLGGVGGGRGIKIGSITPLAPVEEDSRLRLRQRRRRPSPAGEEKKREGGDRLFKQGVSGGKKIMCRSDKQAGVFTETRQEERGGTEGTQACSSRGGPLPGNRAIEFVLRSAW